jgi:endonuclease YncB( thermonuclease family)
MAAGDASGSGAALVRAAVLLIVVALPGARHAEAAETEAALPTPPAFHTKYLSAVSDIQGDSFQFEWEGRMTTIRLRDADSSELDPKRRASAVFLAAQLLEEEPFWFFPCAPLKADTEIRARVWTKKGWLSEVLIMAHLAKRSGGTAGEPSGPAEPPAPTPPGALPPPPCPSAFAAPIQRVIAGDTFEVTREGETVRLRLYDATSEGASADGTQVAAQVLGTDPVWIFPSSQRKPKPGADLPVRIWTREGWLADVLVKASAAKYYDDPDKALEARTEKQGAEPASPTPAQTPAQPTAGASGPSTPEQVVWHRVDVSTALKSTHTIESAVFDIPVAEWRFSWDLKRVMQHAAILVNVCYVDPRYSEVKRAITPAASFTDDRGSTIIRYKPGQYYLRIVGAKELNVKVEYPQKDDSSAP